jgi:hypothetical protein
MVKAMAIGICVTERDLTPPSKAPAEPTLLERAQSAGRSILRRISLVVDPESNAESGGAEAFQAASLAQVRTRTELIPTHATSGGAAALGFHRCVTEPHAMQTATRPAPLVKQTSFVNQYKPDAKDKIDMEVRTDNSRSCHNSNHN